MNYLLGMLLGYIIHDAVQPTAVGAILDKISLPSDLIVDGAAGVKEQSELNVLCKIFNFVLNMFNAVLNVAVEAVNAVIGAAITVLDTAVSSLFGSNGIMGIAIAGVLLYMLWPSDEESQQRRATQSGAK